MWASAPTGTGILCGPMWAYIRDSSSSAPTGAFFRRGACPHAPVRVKFPCGVPLGANKVFFVGAHAHMRPCASSFRVGYRWEQTRAQEADRRGHTFAPMLVSAPMGASFIIPRAERRSRRPGSAPAAGSPPGCACRRSDSGPRRRSAWSPPWTDSPGRRRS